MIINIIIPCVFISVGVYLGGESYLRQLSQQQITTAGSKYNLTARREGKEKGKLIGGQVSGGI